MSTTIQIRLPEDLKASLQARADAECRTLSNLVRQVVEQSHYEYLVRSKVEAARHGQHRDTMNTAMRKACLAGPDRIESELPMDTLSNYFNAERAESLLFIAVGAIALAASAWCLFVLRKPFFTGLAVTVSTVA